QPALLAVSGKDGTPLWCYRSRADGTEPSEGSILGQPALVDVDGDQVVDVVATLAAADRQPPGVGWARNHRRWVEAISGRTVRRLWRAALDSRDFLAAGTSDIPMAARWPMLRNTWNRAGYEGGGDGVYAIHQFGLNGAWEFAHVPYPAAVVRLGGRSVA